LIRFCFLPPNKPFFSLAGGVGGGAGLSPFVFWASTPKQKQISKRPNRNFIGAFFIVSIFLKTGY
jgi:hypothetical protein